MKSLLSGLALVASLLATGAAWAGTLDDITKSGVLRAAYREDAAPFAYKTANGQPKGFMIDLCQAVAKDLAQQLKVPGLKVEFVPVTTENRLDAIRQSKADLLCDSLTVTLERRALVDFSIATFVDGTSFAIRNDGPRDIQQLGGKKSGALAGTLPEEGLRRSLAATHIQSEIVTYKEPEQAMAALEKGEIAAFFAGGAMLGALIKDHKDASRILLANTYLSIEPFGLAMRLGDTTFRLAVDRALSKIYRSGEIATIFSNNFGVNARPTPQLQTLYMLSALPD